ncbi:hypothetical protein Salat_2578400 [Sesamum alatum]|uniref:Uncharacterized protein n=1 Tax=Sesamum alatum TaxID=300844 RepID=A0AAE1XMJ0_9LAMI|nr:hypothetical protein Salat_2578400 [Sesamum alatum]
MSLAGGRTNAQRLRGGAIGDIIAFATLLLGGRESAVTDPVVKEGNERVRSREGVSIVTGDPNDGRFRVITFLPRPQRQALSRNTQPHSYGAFAFTKESLSSVIRRSFLMDDEYCAVMIQMVLIIKGRCRRRLFNVLSVQTSSPSREYRIGSHSCLTSKANESYERVLPRVGSHLTR